MSAKQTLEEVFHAGEVPTPAGFVLRRILPASPLDLFLGWERPTELPVMLLQVPILTPLHGLDGISTSAVRVGHVRLPDDPVDRRTVVVRLTEKALLDEFCLVLDQLIRSLQVICTPEGAIRMLAARLRAWLLLFSPDTGRMSEERQRGLLGELVVLEALATESQDWARALRAWTGPDRRDRDFNFGQLLVEVKTHLAGRRDQIQVANEHQLDSGTGRPPLVLWVLTLVPDETGFTLPARVESIRKKLITDPASLLLFEEKIAAAGYSDLQFEQDAPPPLGIVTHRFYGVSENFPHLRPTGLRPGVLNVSYTVDLKECSRFLKDWSYVCELLKPGITRET